MARMIPDVIPDVDDSKKSEKTIFNSLKYAAQTRDWVVFYSKYVENPGHEVRPLEIDFVILIPEYCSVICLEVKGGHYEIRGGTWYKRGTNESLRSPLDQSRDAMFALKNQFKRTHFRPKSLLSLGCAVAFTDGEIPGDANPQHVALMIGSSDARNSDRLVRTLNDQADRMRPNRTREALDNPFSSELAQQIDWHNLKNELEAEANMEIGPQDPKTIFRSQLETLRPQLLSLTVNQIESLNMVEQNPRCAIDGAAGTGKTVLAMELAKRRCEESKIVALLCSNPNLSQRFERWAQQLSADNAGDIVAGTPATLPSWILKKNSASWQRHEQRLDDSPELERSLQFGYLDSRWPSFVDETVKDLGQGGIFDYLIVDEAQNLCDEVFLKLMNKLLKGGLAEGCFTMFGDFANQNIVTHERMDGRDALKEFIKSRDLPNVTLTKNCRNTHQIAEKFHQLTGIESPPLAGVHGPEVQIEYFGSEEELGTKLNALVDDLRNRGFHSRQIILLSSDDDGFNATGNYGGWQLSNICEAEEQHLETETEENVINPIPADTNMLRYSNIYDFQGLESDVAILVIPVNDNQIEIGGGVILPRDEHLRKMLYTGMSRAKAMLIIVAAESYKTTLRRRQALYSYPPPTHL